MREYAKQGLTLKEYQHIHWYINYVHKKNGTCFHCGKSNISRTEYALLNGRKYSKNIDDYIELCVSCHKKYDFTEEARARVSERMRLGLLSGKYKHRLPKLQSGSNNAMAKPVLKMCKETGDILREYETATVASLELTNGRSAGAISNCLRGRSKTAYGFKWIYKNGK